METRQLFCVANWLTGFYEMGPMTSYRLIKSNQLFGTDYFKKNTKALEKTDVLLA